MSDCSPLSTSIFQYFNMNWLRRPRGPIQISFNLYFKKVTFTQSQAFGDQMIDSANLSTIQTRLQRLY